MFLVVILIDTNRAICVILLLVTMDEHSLRIYCALEHMKQVSMWKGDTQCRSTETRPGMAKRKERERETKISGLLIDECLFIFSAQRSLSEEILLIVFFSSSSSLSRFSIVCSQQRHFVIICFRMSSLVAFASSLFSSDFLSIPLRRNSRNERAREK